MESSQSPHIQHFCHSAMNVLPEASFTLYIAHQQLSVEEISLWSFIKLFVGYLKAIWGLERLSIFQHMVFHLFPDQMTGVQTIVWPCTSTPAVILFYRPTIGDICRKHRVWKAWVHRRHWIRPCKQLICLYYLVCMLTVAKGGQYQWRRAQTQVRMRVIGGDHDWQVDTDKNIWEKIVSLYGTIQLIMPHIL